MAFEEFEPRALPASTTRLCTAVPEGPPGAIFVLAAEGGYAAPAGECAVRFGRGRDAVQVAVGVRDPYISRLHGVLSCEGREWWLRNEGRLPIHLPGDTMVLSGRRLPLAAGYTPLLIRTPRKIAYLLEIYVVSEQVEYAGTDAPVLSVHSDSYPLSEHERLVLVVLAQRYLRQERYPHPVSWKQVAEDLNRVSQSRDWTPRAAADVVDAVRERLSFGDSGAAQGSVLNHQLIRSLLQNTALLPSDLHLLDEETLPPGAPAQV
ncbi:FHA domain-containing protein [Actinospica durhamensis]|uniref:FHA domain-containing protein n=1 Tax=Actinospica durhamensis TaxID=1508375 RepID=A0A941EPV3_9ACTN|nr:FHA domain-containing protein [Actinospica durhamensis]MBR7836300.1 FHA domain-containing protein [Actinospica durhamensis]